MRAAGQKRTALLVDGAVILAAFAAMAVYLVTAVPEFFAESQGGDYPYYVQIAAAPTASSAPAPWRYRLLNPWLASLLMDAGVPADAAFLTLTFVFAFISSVLMNVYLQQLGLSRFAAQSGALLFAVSVGGFIPLRRYYGYTDAMMNAFTLVILVCVQARRHAVATVALGIGTVAKESTLLLVPFLVQRLVVTRAHWHAIAAVVIVPVAVFAVIRLVVPPDATGGAAVALTWAAQVEYWKTAMVHGVVRWLLWAFAYSMGPVWLLSLMAARRHWSFIRQSLLLLLPLLVPLVRTTDTERALMLAFPVVFPLAAFALDEWRGSRWAGAVAGLAIGCSWAAQLTFDWSPEARVGFVTAKDVLFALLSVLPLCPWAWAWAARRTAVIPSQRE